MSEAELIDRYIDALKRDAKALPPAGLDAGTADFVRALVLSQQAKTPSSHLQDRVWHKALTQAETSGGNFSTCKTSSNGSSQHVSHLKSGERLQMDDVRMLMPEPTLSSIPATRPPQPRYLLQYTATIAAVLLVLVVAGSLLIQMAKTPSTGYLALVEATEEPTIEPTPVCNGSTDYMAQGEDSIASGDYAAALSAYNCALELDSTNPAAHLLRGALAGANGDYDQLGYDYYTFIIHNDVNVTDYTRKPVLEILPTLKTAIEARPDDVVLYQLRGLIITSTILDTPIDMIRLMDIAPDNPIGYLFSHNWPYTYDFSDAKLQKAIELAPDSALLDFWLSRGITAQNAAEAKPYFDRAIQANPTHPFAYQARGIINALLGDMTAAANDFYHHTQLSQAYDLVQNSLVIGERFDLKTAVEGVSRLPFNARKGQSLNVNFFYNTGRFPPTLIVLDPQGNVMAVPYKVEDTSEATHIEQLIIPESGVYTLLVKSNSDSSMTILVTGTTK